MTLETHSTPLGLLAVGDPDQLYAAIHHKILTFCKERTAVRLGLSGGSTPKAFFSWWQNALSKDGAAQELVRSQAHFMVSDERMVPTENPESNYGNAHELIESLGAKGYPWPTELHPEAAAQAFEASFKARYPGRAAGFDLCLLGMGSDGHTASLFPGCELLSQDQGRSFAATHWPERGWRLTITPHGLRESRSIVALVCGESKAEMLNRVLTAPLDALQLPIQVLSQLSDRVVWYVDKPAASLYLK